MACPWKPPLTLAIGRLVRFQEHDTGLKGIEPDGSVGRCVRFCVFVATIKLRHLTRMGMHHFVVGAIRITKERDVYRYYSIPSRIRASFRMPSTSALPLPN